MAEPSDQNTPAAIDETLPQVGETTPAGPRGRAAPLTYKAGDRVAERYRIVRALGEGGMGEVYEAEDLLLKERLALKTLRGPVADDEATVARFKREIQLARKVTHPNVCRLFDVGIDRRAGGEVAFLTMELLDGETLAARLKRAGPMSTAEALPIVEQVAAALAAAHEAGIIHRDLKCANVILVGSRAVVTDFGLARVVAEGADQVTGDGGIVGSPAYMAPEQVEGGRRLTAAVDIYAFGVVLFEMVTGKLPFVGETPLATAVMRIREDAPSPRVHVPGLDARWEATILRCLARTPERRPASPRDVVRGLREDPPRAKQAARAPRWVWLLLVLAVPAIFALGTRHRVAPVPPPPPAPGELRVPIPPIPPLPPSVRGYMPKAARDAMRDAAREAQAAGQRIRAQLADQLGADVEEDGAPAKSRRSVAILGFKNLSGKPSADYLSTAFAEMLGTELMAGEALRTVPGESVARARRQLHLPDADSYAPDTLAKLRALLDSDFAVTGSYIVVGEGRIRLDLKLQDTRSGETVTSFAQTGTEAELADLVASAGARLRDALDVEQPSATERAGARALMPRKTDVARLYAEGLAQMAAQNCSAARGPLEQAVAADASFPLAHRALSAVLDCLGYDTRALDEAKQAVALSKDGPAEMRLIAEAQLEHLTGAHDQALASYRELHRRFPDNFDYGIHVAREELATRDTAGARKALAALRKLPPPAGDNPEIDLVDADLDDEAPPAQRLATLERARVKAESLGARLVVASALLLEHHVLRRMGRLDEALAAARQAKEIFQAAGDRDGIILALDAEAQIAGQRKDRAAVARALEQATALGRDLDSVRSLAAFHSHVGDAALHEGDLATAQRELDIALDLLTKHGGRGDLGFTLGTLTLLAVYRGELDRAVGYVDRAAKELRDVGQKSGTALVLSVQAQLAVLKGDLDGARALIGEAATTWPGLVALGADRIVAARIALAEHRWADAETAARHIPETSDGRLWTLRAERARLLVEALVEQGKLGDARAELARARARLAVAGTPLGLDDRLFLDILDASVRGASHKPDDVRAAARALAEAAQRADQVGFVLIARLAELERGRLLLAAGDAHGRTLLAAVAKDADARGLGGLATRARELLGP